MLRGYRCFVKRFWSLCVVFVEIPAALRYDGIRRQGEDMTPCKLVRYFYETVVSQNLSRRLPEFISDKLLVRTGESGLIKPQG